MLKKVLAVVVIVLIAAVIFPKVGVLLKGGQKIMSDKIVENTPTVVDVAMIETLIEDDAEKLSSLRIEVKEMDNKLASDRAKASDIEKAIVKEKDSLIKAEVLLSQNKEIYVVSDETFSYKEIDDDAKARVLLVRKLTRQLASVNEIIAIADSASKTCKVSLAEAYNSQGQKRVDLEELIAREINASIKARTYELTSKARGYSDALTSDTEYQKAMSTYERKVIVLEGKSGDISAPHKKVNYGDSNVQSKTTLDDIHDILN